MKDEFYRPAPGDLAKQSQDNKQGRENQSLPAQEAERIIDRFSAEQARSYKEYSSLIEGGLAKEIARINLPLSLYTEWYWQIDLHNLFRFIALRMDPHAQLEIRRYAERLLEITRLVAPAACESFENHRIGGKSFSAREMRELRNRLGIADPVQSGSSGNEPADQLSPKEKERFESKLAGAGGG